MREGGGSNLGDDDCPQYTLQKTKVEQMREWFRRYKANEGFVTKEEREEAYALGEGPDEEK